MDAPIETSLLTPADVQAFPWARLSAEASRQTTEFFWTKLTGWLRPDSTLSPREKETCVSLAAILSLRPARAPDAEEPFLPTDTFNRIGRAELAPFVAAIEHIPQPDIRALVLDVAWKRKACAYKLVSSAIADYSLLAIYLLPSSWSASKARIERAFRLARGLGKGPDLARATAALNYIILRVVESDAPFFVHSFIELFLEQEEGDWAQLERTVSSLAQRARAEYTSQGIGQGLLFDVEERLLEQCAELQRRQGRRDDAEKTMVEIAEAYVRRANAVLEAQWPQAHSIAASFYRQGLERLRQARGSQQRIEDLTVETERLQRTAVAALARIPMGSLSESGLPTAARKMVSGLPPAEALVTLALNFYAPPAADALDKMVQEQLADAPFRTFVPQSYIGPRGNQVVSHAGVVIDDPSDPGYRIETKRIAYEQQCCVAVATIAPAAHQIAIEHGPSVRDLRVFVECGQFVQPGRVSSYARGLCAGIYQDFDLAAALLFPQIEHCVRELFFANGKATRGFPDNGAENEWDLNRLLADPFAEEIFGPAWAFDLRVLLVDKAGGNLRNKLAHGLVDDGHDVPAKIYLWWTALRLAVFPHHAVLEEESKGGS